MSIRLLVKFAFVAIIIIAIVLSEIFNKNFIYIPEVFYWIESVVLILAGFLSKERRLKDWEYISNIEFAFKGSIFILSIFFIAYKGWFVLLVFYTLSQMIFIPQAIELNAMLKNKESKND